MFMCLVFLMLLRLVIAALWSLPEKADLLALVDDVSCIIVAVPCGILGR